MWAYHVLVATLGYVGAEVVPDFEAVTEVVVSFDGGVVERGHFGS